MAILTTAIDDDREERRPLNVDDAIDDRIIALIRRSRRDDAADDDGRGGITIRPANLASELGLSIEDATRSLCMLLSDVGGGSDGATFVFENVEIPTTAEDVDASTSTSTGGRGTTKTTTTMAFTFPPDFEERASKHSRDSEMRRKLRVVSRLVVRAIKIFAAFGLIISLTVLIIACICLLIAAFVAMARGGIGGGGGDGGRGGNHHLMRKLRYLFFQLRQLLWLYAICGGIGSDSDRDPFLREVAGDLAMMMSVCANPYHPFFWLRLGGMRRRGGGMRRGGGGGISSGGWGGGYRHDGVNSGRIDGIAMMRRGTWGVDDYDYENEVPRSRQQQQPQQRGLLSIAVEFLFGPDKTTPGGPTSANLDKWKYRATVIISMSSKSPGYGVSLRDLLPYVDDPPLSSDDPSAMRETLRMVTYFNGRPVGDDIGANDDGEARRSGMDARFCFPELVAEFDCHSLLSLGKSMYAPPPVSFDNEDDAGNFSSILYKDEGEDDNFGPSIDVTSDETPAYLHEKPHVVTELTRQQFGQCVLLGLLNFVGIVWVQSATMPGGLMELPTSATNPRSSAAGGLSLTVISSFLIIKLLNVLRFYAGFFIALPLCRSVIVQLRNYACRKRNDRRRKFVTSEL